MPGAALPRAANGAGARAAAASTRRTRDATEAGGTDRGRSGEVQLKISSHASRSERLTLAVVIDTPSLIYPARSSIFLKGV